MNLILTLHHKPGIREKADLIDRRGTVEKEATPEPHP
jgi:hypothetical protein